MHYMRWYTTGDVQADRPPAWTSPGLSLRERFEIQVIRPTDPDACWGWRLKPTGQGYSTLLVGGRKGGLIKAHRIAYELFVGPIPDCAVIDHTCHRKDPACPRRRRCVHRKCLNPAHL